MTPPNNKSNAACSPDPCHRLSCCLDIHLQKELFLIGYPPLIEPGHPVVAPKLDRYMPLM